ncbi:MAG TPA: hypothetical protein DEQ41_18320 [Shewanella sp.]|nr:hypothetical protein [Shewanella sp.]
MAFSCGDRLHRQAFFLSLSGNMLLDLPVRPTGFFFALFVCETILSNRALRVFSCLLWCFCNHFLYGLFQ